MDCSQAGRLLKELWNLDADSQGDETEDVFFLGACGNH